MARSTVTDQPATRAEEGAKPFGASKHTLRELGQLKPKQVRADKGPYTPDLHGAVRDITGSIQTVHAICQVVK